MKDNQIYSLNALLILGIIFTGCSHKPVNTAEKATQTQTAVQKVQTTGIRVSDLKNSSVATNLALKANDVYAVNEPIQFIVDTGEEEGYLYIIYLDDKGNTEILYPNKNAPSSEMSGDFLFPRDFGNMHIRATKNCTGCDKERTTIYAILSKKPILDIKNITKDTLLNITQPKNRGLSLELNNNNNISANLNVTKIDFFIK